MARVEIASQGWGWVADEEDNGVARGVANATISIKTTDGGNATHYSALTAGTSSTSTFVSNSDGSIPRYIDEGTYDVTVTAPGQSPVLHHVEAVSGRSRRDIMPVNAQDPQGIYQGAVGDNVADDSDALERAYNAAVTRNVPLYVPGTVDGYKVTRAAIRLITNGAQVFGDGPRLSVLKPTHAGAAIEIGDGSSALFNQIVENIGIAGTSSNTHGIKLTDGASRWTISNCRITGLTTGEAIGMTETGATPSHFSGLIRRCELTGNATGIRAQGRHQNLTIDTCLIFNNTAWGINAEGDSGSIAGGRINIINTQVEKNGNTANTTGSIRLAGVDVINISGWYNEQDGTWPGCAMLIDQDETGVGCTEVDIAHSYLLGNNLATKGIIVKYVNGLTLRNNRGLNFTTTVVSYEPGAISRLVERGNNWNTDNLDLFIGTVDPRTPAASTAMAGSGTAYVGAFSVSEVRRPTLAHFSVATQSGNIEIAIYDNTGARVATTGSFLCPAAGGQQRVLTTTPTLMPWRTYYAVVTSDNATVALHFVSLVTQGLVTDMGLGGQVTGTTFPLPASLTLPGTGVSRSYFLLFN